jgi:lipopolysaccharide transport system ATP-binding protein
VDNATVVLELTPPVPSTGPADRPLAISARGLGKKYLLGEMHRGVPELKDVLVQSVIRRLGQRRRHHHHDREVFWALRNVSFDIRQGEAVAVIGRNGSGKSTLLQILARAVPPTEGRAVVRGRVAPILSVGAGFNPEFTGRENIIMSGVILGLTRKEIERRMPEITAFAGVDQFLDTPVKRYSSGMYVRLAFSVVAHVDADVLLADEVLAVGDMEFRARCFDRMESHVRDGRTLLFVSHSTSHIRRICTRAIYLAGGHLVADGPVEDVLAMYEADVEAGERGGRPTDRPPGAGGRRLELD